MIRKGRFMLWYDSMCIKENKSIFMVVCFSIPQPQKQKQCLSYLEEDSITLGFYLSASLCISVCGCDS